MKVLVTGGSGYIGSHSTVELLSAGHQVVIVDNLSNSSPEVLARIHEITGKQPIFVEADITDEQQLDKIFSGNTFDAVIHFAALKAVGESVNKSLLYYQNNISGMLNVLKCMERHSVRSLIFSSSATIYGDPEEVPLKETSRVGIGITNPYGHTKVMCEQILQDVAKNDPELSITLLRYFNPVGAHESGLIGEDPNGIPNNLLPYVAQVAVGKLPELRVFGNDYNTPDGTGVRDYIHVVDLAKGHLAALTKQQAGVSIYNLGTGTGYSVLEMIQAFEKASGTAIAYKVVDRRPGDIAACYSDPSKAFTELGWKAEKTLQDMCADAWRWQSKNPEGFA